MEDPVVFYNKFDKKLINDYVSGNIRIESAIINLASFVPEKSKNILDIGSGLGWSSHEFAKCFKNANVEGIDFSPVLTKNARKLFRRDNLSYKVFDITRNLPDKTYDSVVMIDVYEHIAFEERSAFHQALKSIINDQGRLLLACPSKYHQAWLKKYSPQGLQPVDEDVDYETLCRLAQDIGGEVTYFEYQKVWRNFDYFHAVIEIGPVYNSSYRLNGPKLKLEGKPSRVKRVNRSLGMDVRTPSGNYSFKNIKRKLRLALKKIKSYK